MLTQAGAADQGGGGERPSRRAVDLPGVGDEEGGMFLQAAGYSDVVDPQEAAAGEGDIPGGIRGEHGLRAPLETGGRVGKKQLRRGRETAGLLSHHTAPGRVGRKTGDAATKTRRQNARLRRWVTGRGRRAYMKRPGPQARPRPAEQPSQRAAMPALGGKHPAAPSNPSPGEPSVSAP